MQYNLNLTFFSDMWFYYFTIEPQKHCLLGDKTKLIEVTFILIPKYVKFNGLFNSF